MTWATWPTQNAGLRLCHGQNTGLDLGRVPSTRHEPRRGLHLKPDAGLNQGLALKINAALGQGRTPLSKHGPQPRPRLNSQTRASTKAASYKLTVGLSDGRV